MECTIEFSNVFKCADREIFRDRRHQRKAMATDGFEFDPYSMDVQENPYPYYAVLRNDHPLYWCENANCWALSRYEDIASACNDAKRFSSARGNVLDDDPARMGNTLGTSDPPKHDRLRGLVNAAFMRGRVVEREPQMRAITRNSWTRSSPRAEATSFSSSPPASARRRSVTCWASSAPTTFNSRSGSTA